MNHIMEYTEWKSASGLWRTGDVSALAKNSNAWWYVPRMLNISITEYIILLKDKFNAINFKYFEDANLLLWHWKSYNDCHKFTLFVNKEARARRFCNY